MLFSKFAGLSLIPQNPQDNASAPSRSSQEQSTLHKYESEKSLSRHSVKARFMTQDERDSIINGTKPINASKAGFERW